MHAITAIPADHLLPGMQGSLSGRRRGVRKRLEAEQAFDYLGAFRPVLVDHGLSEGRSGLGQVLLAGVVEWDRFGERNLEAEVARAVPDLPGADVRVVGMVEQGVCPVVGAVGGPAEGRAEYRRLAALRQDPAELAPALHLVLRVAVLMEAGADRDHKQVVLVEVVGILPESLPGLDDPDHYPVRG